MMESIVSSRSETDAKLMIERLVGDGLQQIQRYSCEENMAFITQEPNELIPMEQSLRRISVVDGLPAVITQTNILETVPNMCRNREVAVGKTSERLKNEAEELEKSLLFVSTQKTEYEKLIELLKEAENDIREVMSGIENEDEGEDDEFAAHCQNFQDLKADLKYVLKTLCPEYKEDIENFLRMLESDEDEWVRMPDDMDLGAIMLLLRCKIIVQHPEENEYFKWAPFSDI